MKNLETILRNHLTIHLPNYPSTTPEKLDDALRAHYSEELTELKESLNMSLYEATRLLYERKNINRTLNSENTALHHENVVLRDNLRLKEQDLTEYNEEQHKWKNELREERKKILDEAYNNQKKLEGVQASNEILREENRTLRLSNQALRDRNSTEHIANLEVRLIGYEADLNGQVDITNRLRKTIRDIQDILTKTKDI